MEFLGKWCVNSNPSAYSFFVINHPKKNEIKQKLFQKQIYLPTHWPGNKKINPLFSSLLSIPLFEEYADNEFEYLSNTLKRIIVD